MANAALAHAVSVTGPHSFTDEHGKEWRIVGLYEHAPGYASIERVEDGAKSVRLTGILTTGGLSMPVPEDVPAHLVTYVETNDAPDAIVVSTPTTRVVNRKTGEPFDVDIGRPGPWGNPYSHLPGTSATYVVGTREEAISLYREWIKLRLRSNEVGLLEALAGLRGRALGCYCAPEPCHGDVLAAAAEWATLEVDRRRARAAEAPETQVLAH